MKQNDIHWVVRRNNTYEMLPKASQQAHSKGELINKQLIKLVTSEGEKLKATEVIESDWYDQPQ